MVRADHSIESIFSRSDEEDPLDRAIRAAKSGNPFAVSRSVGAPKRSSTTPSLTAMRGRSIDPMKRPGSGLHPSKSTTALSERLSARAEKRLMSQPAAPAPAPISKASTPVRSTKASVPASKAATPSPASRSKAPSPATKAKASAPTRQAKAATPAEKPKPSVPASPSHVIQDVIRPGNPAGASTPEDPYAGVHDRAFFSEAARPATPSTNGSSRTTRTSKNPLRSIVRRPSNSLDSEINLPEIQNPNRPLDSVKNRFRPAPRDYAISDLEEVEKTHRYHAEDFLNPSHPARQIIDETPAPVRDSGGAKHLYGLMSEPEQLSDVPSWAQPDVPAPTNDDLGVVEDYRHRDGSPVIAKSDHRHEDYHGYDRRNTDRHDEHTPEDDLHSEHSEEDRAPDNNRYVLGAKSPFFLSSVNVEKRPLGGAPTDTPVSETENPVYAGQNFALATTKVHYEKPLAKSKTKEQNQSSENAEKSQKSEKSQKHSHSPFSRQARSEKYARSENFEQPPKKIKKHKFEEFGAGVDPAPEKLNEPTLVKATAKNREQKASPTVIIPSRTRSKSSLFFLLLVTVILGGIVGALIYLCLFQ